MKKLLQVLLFSCLVLFNVQVGSAADKIWVDEDFDLTSVHRLYFGDMNYAESQESPKAADIMAMFATQSTQGKMMVLQQADLDRLLLRDFNVNLKNLDDKQKKSAIREHLDTYVDAYVVPTIVHNQRVVMFFDLHSVKTGKMVFSYQAIASPGDDDELSTYEALTKDFYKALDKEISKQLKNKK